MLYAIEKKDGGVAVMNIVDDKTDPAAEIKRLHPDTLAGLKTPHNFRPIAARHLPVSREFRDGWEFSGTGPVGINIARARAIHASRINQARGTALDVLERERVQAELEGRLADATQSQTDKSAISALDLGAIATAIKNAADVNSLGAIWPAELARFRSPTS